MRSWALFVVLVVAALLRLADLSGESLWLDEASTAFVVRGSYADLLRPLDRTELPLYYVLLKTWVGAFGGSEGSLRLPSALLGIATVPLFHRWVERLLGRGAALGAAALLAVNPFAIYYAQEARSYALFLFLSTASLLFQLEISRRSRWTDVAGYALSSAGALLTHPYGVFLLLAHGCIHLVLRREPGFTGERRWWSAVGLFALLSLPQAVWLILAYADKAAGAPIANWIPEPKLKTLIGTALYYFGAPWVGGLALSFGAAFALHGLSRAGGPRRALLVLLSLPFGLLLVPWLVSTLGAPIFTPRYTIVALLGCLALIGHGLAELRGVARRVAVAAVVIAHALPLYAYYTKTDKEPWREASAFLGDRVRAGDLVLPIPVDRPLAYYFEAPAGVNVASVQDLEGLSRALAAAKRVWAVEWYVGSLVGGEAALSALRKKYQPSSAVVINDSLAVNPNSRWIRTIRVVAWERKPTASSSASASASTTPIEVSTPLAPLGNAAWLERMTLDGGGTAYVALPLGAREPRPIVVAAHGAGDRAEWACGGWRIAAEAYPFVVCPQGSPMGHERFGWASGRAIVDSVDRALHAVRTRFGAYVAEGPAIYAGFSQGASLAREIMFERTGLFPTAILAEGGYELLADPSFAPEYRRRGGQVMMIVCGGSGCQQHAARARARLEHAGLRVVLSGDSLSGHNLNERMQRALRASWQELVTDQPSWETFPRQRWAED